MKILAIDTSTNISSIALYINDKVIDSIEEKIDKSHSGILAKNVDRIINDNNLKYEEIEYYLISIGPGSYSGLKVGSSFLKGLTFPIDKPIISINSLYALNSQIIDNNEYIIAIFSHRDYVYCQKFSNGKPIGKQSCRKIKGHSATIYGYGLDNTINYTEVVPSSLILIDYFIKNKDMYISNLNNENISPIYLEIE